MELEAAAGGGQGIFFSGEVEGNLEIKRVCEKSTIN